MTQAGQLWLEFVDSFVECLSKSWWLSNIAGSSQVTFCPLSSDLLRTLQLHWPRSKTWTKPCLHLHQWESRRKIQLLHQLQCWMRLFFNSLHLSTMLTMLASCSFQSSTEHHRALRISLTHKATVIKLVCFLVGWLKLNRYTSYLIRYFLGDFFGGSPVIICLVATSQDESEWSWLLWLWPFRSADQTEQKVPKSWFVEVSCL